MWKCGADCRKELDRYADAVIFAYNQSECDIIVMKLFDLVLSNPDSLEVIEKVEREIIRSRMFELCNYTDLRSLSFMLRRDFYKDSVNASESFDRKREKCTPIQCL